MNFVNDKDKFVLESANGGQWYVCNLLGKESKDGLLDYEIVEVCYSEEKAKERLVEMYMFSQSQKDMTVVKNSQKQKGNTRASLRVPKSERKKATLKDIL